ncbi:uncharacterized protein LOC143182166 [Calliopsis andreniformis]|uniref:uncharacterized protein LOC143182166 n=1 Tax=Calliopsis andreniformis TaxID=337506 RepID=UPI003FCDFE55
MGTVWYHFLSILLLLSVVSSKRAEWIPCVELKRNLHVPCKCSVTTETEYPGLSIEMNCDRAIFTRDVVESLRGQPVVSISQRNSGYQTLPEDLLESGLSLRKLDLSGNSIHKLMNRLLRAQPRLEELRLADNLLGDSLNPIFSSNEFHGMKELKLLDLSRNGLRSIEEGIFKGCENLEQLYLDGNKLTLVPTVSLKGPRFIRVLSLSGNNIESLPRAAFSMVGESLQRLDLSDNEMSHVEDSALSGLEQLLFLNISHNHLNRFNSDVFKGVHNLLQLDLSANFFQEFPNDALENLADLKFLNISNNLITEIEERHLSGLRELQILDLSRNNIGRLGVNAFSGLPVLTKLDLSLNALRTIEESSFEGLTKLRWLSLQDNNILLVPAAALTRLPSLIHLHVEFNRIAALSTELIKATASSLFTLGLKRNLVREIPTRLFHDFENLASVDLSGNMLTTISQSTFSGLEDTLVNLDLSHNRLTSIGELPLRSLISFNLAANQLTRVPPDTFKHLQRVQYLNLSSNPLYGGFPPIFPSSILVLDVSHTDLRVLPKILFLNLESLERISISGNHLEIIEEGTFQRLRNLSRIDLSNNRIERIENGAFAGISSLYELNLRGNRLTSFAGEYFDTGTGLEDLNLSGNRIDRLSSTAFAIHPRLRRLDLSDNRFIHFPGDYLKSLQFLEWINLSGNALKRVSEFAFSQIGRLRILDLSRNEIELVDELAFHNSTQLQLLDLSYNKIETLSERTMEGLLRFEHLSLQNNKLAFLPETIFDPARVRSVESIDLSGNRFNEIPMRTLQRQSVSLTNLNVARNRVTEVFTQDIVSNIKHLDISENPLSENAIKGILGEAKILRSLNLANTGITTVNRLETPFLRQLNLSGNAIVGITSVLLERTTMLESLDVSRNKLTDFTKTIAAFKILPALRWLDVSGNDAKIINESTFDGFTALRSLKMFDLPNCTRIEKNAFKPLRKLRSLAAYNYPKLGYFDVQGILKGMNHLETLDIEIKDSSVSSEQLSILEHSRLREVILRGERLKNVLSSTLVGVRGAKLSIAFKNTSINTIPAALFFPVPRSTKLDLDLSGNKFTTLSSQFLAALDERSGTVSITGLESNPINCDCNAKQLWRWLKIAPSTERFFDVLCVAPPHLAGSILTSLVENSLSCEFKSTPFPTKQQSSTTMLVETTPITPRKSMVSEPEIIWTVAPAVQNNRNKQRYNQEHPLNGSSIGNGSGTDDTLIIGIVGGVVALIAIIVIVICICRLRWSGRIDQARMPATTAASIHEASIIRPASAYSGKMNHDLYVGSYNGSTLDRGNAPINSSIPTTPVQMMPLVQPMHLMHTLLTPTPLHQLQSQLQSQLQPHSQSQQIYGYCDSSSLPMYVACSTDNKSNG